MSALDLNQPAELAKVLEALLLASGKVLSLAQLMEFFEEAERAEPAVFRKALQLLEKSCKGRALELKEVASGYRLQVRSDYAQWVGRLWEERPQRYSRALLETLALIAYRQPISRGEIEEVRGVAVSSQIMKTLQERDWIRVVGHRDVPGRPALWATTKAFLDHFALTSLEALPPLQTLKEMPVPAEDEPFAPVASLAVEPSSPTVPAAAEALSFNSLLAELDQLEQGLKNDFDDLTEPLAEAPDNPSP